MNASPAILQYPSAALHSYGFDVRAQHHVDVLNAVFSDFDFVPNPSDGEYWLITEEGAVLREANYYLYGLSEQSVSKILDEGKQTAPINWDQLSKMHFIQYPAQDGLLVNGFVILPKGRQIDATPMVTYVHGGPFARIASQRYSESLQMLANRGYIVFLPNFRGSTGYGRQYILSSNKDFGDGVVQQDIVDGVHYLLSHGIGDPEKLAIVGGSFGGFAVLSGLAFTPDLFKAGFAAVPPADLATGLRENPKTYESTPILREKMKQLLVDQDDPEAKQALYDKSPRASLETISAPLLVLAGADDKGVDIKHIKEYSLALFNNGNVITLLIDEDEGHTFLSEESTAAYLYLMEEFLAVYLGGDKEGLGNEALQNYLEDNIQLNSNSEFLPALR